MLSLVSTTTQTDIRKIGGKVAHGPQNSLLEFGGNPDHVMLGLGLGQG